MEEPTPFERLSWPVRTERLLLRPLEADDVPAVFEIRRQPEVARWSAAHILRACMGSTRESPPKVVSSVAG